MEKKVDQRVQRTENAIVTTFFELLEEKHFNNITIIDICKKALINRGTFYTHFEDKYQLLERCVYVMMKSFDEEVRRLRGDNDIMGYYQDMFEVAVGFVTKNKKAIKTIIHKVDSKTVFNQIHAIVIRNIMKNVGKLTPKEPNPPLEVMAEFFGAGLIQVVRWWIVDEPTYPVDQMKTHLFRVVRDTLERYYVLQ